MLTRQKATSWSWTGSWTRGRRWRCSGEVGTLSERADDEKTGSDLRDFRAEPQHQHQASAENERVRPDMIEVVRLIIIKCVGEQAEKHERNPSIGHRGESRRLDCEHRAKSKKERPHETDHAPWRFVFDDAVGHQRPDAVDREVTQRHL